MILATTQFAEFDRFWSVFTTAGAEKRAEHGCKGASCSATRPSPTASGSSSTGTTPAGRASSPTRRSPGHEGSRPSRQAVHAALPRRDRGLRRSTMTTPNTDPIKVGVITDLTGALSFMGIANANVGRHGRARHQRDRRPAGPPSPAVRRGQRDRRRRRRSGGRASSSTNTTSTSCSAASTARHGRPSKAPSSSGAEALHLPRAVRGPGMRPADLLHRPGAGAADRAAVPVADAAHRREALLPAVGRLHLAACAEREGARGRDRRRRHHRRRGVPPARPHGLRPDRRRIMASGAEVVFNTIVPPGLTPFLAAAARGGFTQRGGHLVCTYFDENFLNLVPAEQVEGLYGCLDYYRDVDRPVQRRAAAGVRRSLPGQRAVHRRQRVHGHVPRAEAVGGGRHRGRFARHRTPSSRRSTRAIAEGPAARRRWCPVSTTCG